MFMRFLRNDACEGKGEGKGVEGAMSEAVKPAKQYVMAKSRQSLRPCTVHSVEKHQTWCHRREKISEKKF